MVLIEDQCIVPLTGTHRQAAAQKAKVAIPAIVLTLDEACEALKVADLSEYDYMDHNWRAEQVYKWAKAHGHADLAAALGDQY